MAEIKKQDIRGWFDLADYLTQLEMRIESLERQVDNLDSRTTGSVQIGTSAKKWKPENQNL